MPPPDLAGMRRGWCPTVGRPMTTGDGLLVRLHPRHARLDLMQARAIAAAARACGNGLIDLTGRGNLQIRGVSAATHARLAERLAAAGADGDDDGAFCIVPPLAGIDPAECLDAPGLANAIDARLRRLARAGALSPKFAVVIDGGGRQPLDDVEADIRLVAIDSAHLAVAIAAAEGDLWIGSAPRASAPEAVASLAAALCAEGAARRFRQLSPEARRRIAGRAALAPVAARPARAPGQRIGAVPLGAGASAVGLGLPYGRMDAALLERLAGWSADAGGGELRLSPWRALFIPAVPDAAAPHLMAAAAAAGLIVDPFDPRRAITACPGAPACGRASVATHADAARLAAAAGRLLGEATVHVSGCAKGCARRAPADLTLVGEAGGYGIVLGGTAQDEPRGRLDIAAIAARLALLRDDTRPGGAAGERLAAAFAPSS
jgi:precorrin-3B synthase